jgi:hypothetical protein
MEETKRRRNIDKFNVHDSRHYCTNEMHTCVKKLTFYLPLSNYTLSKYRLKSVEGLRSFFSAMNSHYIFLISTFLLVGAIDSENKNATNVTNVSLDVDFLLNLDQYDKRLRPGYNKSGYNVL